MSVCLILERLEKNDPLSLFAVFARLKQMNQCAHTLIQDVKQLPSSVGNIDLATLANDTDKDGWLDPISHESISKADIRAPYYFLIGKYVTRVENALKVIFNYSDEKNHRIRHPIENRFMTEEEHKKFLNDICRLFSITETDFLSLWNNHPITGIPNSLLSKTNDIRVLFRTCNFLGLIPEEVKKHHLKSIVRHDQLNLLARLFVLSAKPNKWSFDYPEAWIELPLQEEGRLSSICKLVHRGSISKEFPPAIVLSKYAHSSWKSKEEFKAKLMSQKTKDGTTISIEELGHFSPSAEGPFSLFRHLRSPCLLGAIDLPVRPRNRAKLWAQKSPKNQAA
jgi:hypothetical protein